MYNFNEKNIRQKLFTCMCGDFKKGGLVKSYMYRVTGMQIRGIKT